MQNEKQVKKMGLHVIQFVQKKNSSQQLFDNINNNNVLMSLIQSCSKLYVRASKYTVIKLATLGKDF